MKYIALLFATACLSVGCSMFCTDGSGKVVVEKREAKGFEAIHAEGAITVYLLPDTAESIEIRADDNLVPQIETKLSGKTLHIKTLTCVEHHNRLEVYVSYVKLTDLKAYDAAKITSRQNLTGSDMVIETNDAAEINLEVSIENLEVESDDASKITLTGRCDELEVVANEASVFNASMLQADDVEVQANDAAECKVYAKKSIDAEANDSGQITYSGNPQSVDNNANDAGKVKPAN